MTRSTISRVAGVEKPEWDTVHSVEKGTRTEVAKKVERLREYLKEKIAEEETLNLEEKRDLGGLMGMRSNRVGTDPVENMQAGLSHTRSR